MRFQDLPIKRKLMLAILLTSTTALLLACAAVVVYEVAHYRRTAVNDLYMQALTMGENSATAVVFDDQRAAQRYLNVLRFRPDIVQACLYATDSTVVAEYNPAGSLVPPIPAHPENEGSQFQGTYLSLFHRLKLGNDLAGTIFLRSDLRGELARLRSYVCVVIIVALISLLGSMLFSRKLQRLIAEPVLDLARVARKVTEANDYSIRVTKHSQDEIGILTDGFNEMLTRIEQRDQELHNSEQRFRQLAEAISEVFWMTNVEKTEMIYVSPAYERIWGRTCSDLYAAPYSWTEAVHPEDRERVRLASMTKQITGEYNQEYRIVRPDGTIRWIQDRAFPIQDAKGTVYRIAGIAEDITERNHLQIERKQLEREILEISDREQARLGQDLHDGLCQQLVRTTFACKILEQEMGDQPSSRQDRARKIAELLDDAITQTRDITRGLYPVQLDGEGFDSVLKDLCANISEKWAIPCVSICADAVTIPDSTLAMHLYRIAQEAVTNAVKHAKCTHVVVELASNDAAILLMVTDDGVGIENMEQLHQGMGFHIMRYRANLIGASLEIEKGPSGGTIVCCSLPK